jgi:hypothetical protein
MPTCQRCFGKNVDRESSDNDAAMLSLKKMSDTSTVSDIVFPFLCSANLRNLSNLQSE